VKTKPTESFDVETFLAASGPGHTISKYGSGDAEMIEQRCADLGCDTFRKRCRQVHTMDLRAQRTSDFLDLQQVSAPIPTVASNWEAAPAA
jgi:hypothetical protein